MKRACAKRGGNTSNFCHTPKIGSIFVLSVSPFADAMGKEGGDRAVYDEEERR